MFARRLIILGVVSSMLFAALPALAREGSDNKPSSPYTAEVGVCMQTAVGTRDTAVLAAFDTYSSAVHTALVARNTALMAAWVVADKTARHDAHKAAWDSWKNSMRTARTSLRDAKKTAWDKFGADRKTCKASEDMSGRGADAQL